MEEQMIIVNFLKGAAEHWKYIYDEDQTFTNELNFDIR